MTINREELGAEFLARQGRPKFAAMRDSRPADGDLDGDEIADDFMPLDGMIDTNKRGRSPPKK